MRGWWWSANKPVPLRFSRQILSLPGGAWLCRELNSQLIEMVPESSRACSLIIIYSSSVWLSHGANVIEVRLQDQLLAGWLFAPAQGYKGGCGGIQALKSGVGINSLHPPATRHRCVFWLWPVNSSAVKVTGTQFAFKSTSLITVCFICVCHPVLNVDLLLGNPERSSAACMAHSEWPGCVIRLTPKHIKKIHFPTLPPEIDTQVFLWWECGECGLTCNPWGQHVNRSYPWGLVWILRLHPPLQVLYGPLFVNSIWTCEVTNMWNLLFLH